MAVGTEKKNGVGGICSEGCGTNIDYYLGSLKASKERSLQPLSSEINLSPSQVISASDIWSEEKGWKELEQ